MSKTSKQEMIHEIGDFLHVYMKAGKINKRPFFEHIHSNISDMEKLLKVHFLLKSEVIEYIKRLPDLFKQFKTTTKSLNKITEEEIRGKIDWQSTIQTRIKRNKLNSPVYSVTERNRMYDSNENIVLKKLLSVIYHLVFEHKLVDNQYEWGNAWNNELRNSFEHIYIQNIYLKRIVLPKNELDIRMIYKATQHRSPLYAEAASLLLLYYRITNNDLDNDEIIELLNESFIEPDSTETLFELYWIMKLIKENNSESLLHIYDGNNKNLVASWIKKGIRYNIYHNSIGSGIVKFSVPLEDIQNSEHPYLIQKEKSILMQKKFSQVFFDSTPNTIFFNGRPDILIEGIDVNNHLLHELSIGEVKYTNSESYALVGLDELIDYIHFAKHKNDYVLNQDITIKGMLFLDKVNVKFSDSTFLEVYSLNENNHE